MRELNVIKPGQIGWVEKVDPDLIRLMLLPALLRLTGRAAWWSPTWLRKVLPAISFSH